MKGDRVEVVIDSGDGTQTYEVAATRAGRRVDITNRRGIIEVSEVTRTGTPIRTARFRCWKKSFRAIIRSSSRSVRCLCWHKTIQTKPSRY